MDLSAQPDSTIPVAIDPVFTKVEVDAEFPGGLEGWKKYLQENMHTAVPRKLKAGTYQVMVRFIVDKDGSIQDVVAETNFGFGLEKEAIRVIKKGPKWIPAMQNGVKVKAYRRQPITWVVE